jgi:hypothetical protein
MDEELSVLKAIATITVEDNVKEEAIKKIQSRLEDFSIKLKFKQHGKRIDLSGPSKKIY